MYTRNMCTRITRENKTFHKIYDQCLPRSKGLMIMSNSPLNMFQARIMHSAHYAAQQVIEKELADEFNSRKLSKAKQRKRILDELENNGFGRFLLEKNEFIGLSIAPYSYTETDKDEHGSWSAQVKYNVSEVVAYLNSRRLLSIDTAIDYISSSFGSEPYYGGPGQAFNSGWNHHTSKCGKRIIGEYSAGYDI